MVEQLTELVIEAGPWIVLLMTFIETAFFIGLLIPAEPTILIAAFLAERGYFSVWSVLAATALGGFLGDQTGYLFGRFGGSKIVAKQGLIARIWQRHEPRAARLFRKHTSLSVSLARFISFVRTLMPWFAGMTRMPYGRYLVYDVLGVAGWAAASVALGYVAGESWEAAAHVAGRWTVGIVAGIALIALVIARRRKRTESVSESVSESVPVLRVGLTGNIASGKSSVVEVWRSLGAQVIDADVLARRAIEPGTPGHLAVVHAFGADIVAADGSIDRARLRERVFADGDERARLEAIVHPEVARLRAQEEAKLSGIVVNDIPLLYEAGLADQFDLVVHVHADDDIRLQRLVSTRGLSEEVARAMMQAQLSTEHKKQRADIVIDNNGTLTELEQAARAAWQRIQEWPKPSA